MTNSITINQKQGIGSSGTQGINIDQSIHNYPRAYKNLVETHNGAISFDPNKLREIIISIASEYEEIEKKPKDFSIISLEQKNKLNNLTQSFYEQIISRDYEPYFYELDLFLKQRANEDIQGLVGKIIKSLNKKILASCDKFTSFEALLIAIEEALLDSQYAALHDKEEMISLFLYYGRCE
jgi:aspartyl aminopeptidase